MIPQVEIIHGDQINQALAAELRELRAEHRALIADYDRLVWIAMAASTRADRLQQELRTHASDADYLVVLRTMAADDRALFARERMGRAS